MVKNEKMTQKNYPTQGQDLDETFFFNFSVLSVTFFTKGIFFSGGGCKQKSCAFTRQLPARDHPQLNIKMT